MTSEISNAETILKIVHELKPERILDVGSGFGKFAVLVREALLSQRAGKGDLMPEDNIIIDCVECARYFWRLPYHKILYNHHYHGNVENYIFGRYDLVLMIDMVEHTEKTKGLEIINKLRYETKGKLIISTPKRVQMYKTYFYGADCPIHHSQWTAEDFTKLNGIDYSTKVSWIYLI